MDHFPRWLLVWTAGLALAASLPAGAAPIAWTGFESEPAVPGFYTDTGDAGADHDLANNLAEPLIDSTAASTVAGDLGFDARYVNSRGGVGLTDGDFVGVTEDVGVVGAFTEGSRGYRLSDADGTMIVEFDPVDLTGVSGASILLDLFVRDADWESDDLVRVVLELGGAADLVLLDTSGLDIDDLAIEGAWRTLGAAIPDAATSGRLRVELESDQAAEEIYLDRVAFVPEPGTALLLAGGLLGLARWRSGARVSAV